MATTVKPGMRLFSAVCSTELMVVRAPSGDVDRTIGGVPPVTSPAERTGQAPVAGHDGGVAIGKRYVDPNGSVELLATKPGPGVPAIDGAVMQVKGASALPASD